MLTLKNYIDKLLAGSYFLLLILFLFVTHFLLTFFFETSSYNVSRIIVNLSLYTIILYYLIFKHNLLQNIFYSNKWLVIFTIPILEAFFSQYINSSFEQHQQIFISTTYFFTILVVLIIYEQNKYLSMLRFLYLIILLNIIIFSFILSHYLFINSFNLSMSIWLFFENVRFLNHLQTLFIPLLLFGTSLSKLKSIRILSVFFLIVNFLFLYYTGARGSFISIVSASLFIYFTASSFRPNINKLFFIAIASFIIYFIFILIFSFEVNGSEKHLLSVASTGRLDIYNKIIPYIFNFDHLIYAIGFSSQDIAIYGFMHPHNLYLYIFLGFGTVGLVLVLLLTFYYIILLLKQYLSSQNTQKIYLIFTLIAVWVHSLVSGLYISPLTSLLLIYLFALISSKYFKHEKKDHHSIKKYGIVISGFLIVLVCLNIASMFNTIEDLKRYSFTKEEILDKNFYKQYRPGIMLFNNKAIDG